MVLTADMIFFCEATVAVTPYLADSSNRFQYRNVIVADSYDNARMKLFDYWAARTREYEVSYYVVQYEITEAIG